MPDDLNRSNHPKNLSNTLDTKDDIHKSAKGFSFAEIKGRRKTQQDSGFIGFTNNQEAKQNPAEFLSDATIASEKQHKECKNGTTICSAIVKENEITVANLGDSRAALIIRHKGIFRDRFTSILLSEDHDLSIPRVAKQVKEKGGSITEDKGSLVVNGKLTMGGSIGDKATIGQGQDCLIRKPDIFQYNLSELYQKTGINPEKVIDVDLIVSCDGLWDLKKASPEYVKVKTDFEFKIDDKGEQKLKQNYFSSFLENISKVKKSHLKKPNVGLATVAAEKSFNKGSKDNISVAHIAIIAEGDSVINEGKAVMATICDGHGDGLGQTEEIDVYNSELKQNWDGLIVASSVAADIHKAAEIEDIKGLEVDQKKQSYLSKFLGLQSAKEILESEKDSINWQGNPMSKNNPITNPSAIKLDQRRESQLDL
ncbi:MAG: hypothetical protein EBS06_07725 [Proteobacteria bacterium]|nr:hypothetical protein [Pseudomonadota bacterium]